MIGLTYLRGSSITAAFHPAPAAEVLAGNWNVPVHQGQICWVDAFGEKHKIEA